MNKSTFTATQMVDVLSQAEASALVGDVCRQLGISEQTFYRWKKRFAGIGVAELYRLRQLEEENRTLKQLIVDLLRRKHMLRR